MAFDLLIHNGTVITVNSGFEIIENGIIGIENTKITYVSEQPRDGKLPMAGEYIDANGGLILPGLVNTHTHLPMTLFRGLADDLPLKQWLNEYIFPAEGKYLDAHTVRAGTLLACAELLLSGTTTCCDGYFFEKEVARAVNESGIRAVLGQGIVDFPAPGVPDPLQNVAIAAQFVRQWQDVSHRIDPALFCHSPYTCSADTLRRAKRAALDAGVLFQIHVAETREEVRKSKQEHGASPVEYLERLGILDPHTLVVHAVWVTRADIDILARRGVGISHNPESNMKLAAGIAPVPEMLAEGIAVGLGTDGSASNNDLDLFGALSMAAKLHKVNTQEPTAVSAACALKMATIEGAKAMGLSTRIGSIETGKEADVIVVDTRKPHMVPMYNPVSQLVYSARGSDVVEVVVAGKPVVRGRRLVRLNPNEIMERIREIAIKIQTCQS